MTHIDNIKHIVRYGITHSTSDNANPNYKSIGDNNIISTRNCIVLKSNKALGDYIPFYFGKRMPMLYVIQNGYNGVTRSLPQNIVYCVVSIQEILNLNLDFVFTDGHSNEKFTKQYDRSDVKSINEILDKKAIESQFWNDENDLDLKRRKQAEFLVLGDIDSSAILGYIVFNQEAKNKLIYFGVDNTKIKIQPQSYF